MDFKGKVIVLNQPTGGTSKNGNVWKKQELIVEELEGQFPNSMAFEIFGEEKIAKFDVRMGDIVDVKFNSKATSYNGRCFNQHQIWSLTKQGGYSNKPNTQSTQTRVNRQEPQQTATSADDLPF